MNNIVNYNTEQSSNNTETYTVSIIKKNPFIIEDSIISLDAKLNDIGVIYISQTRTSQGLIAHVINNNPQTTQPGMLLNRQDNTLKFTLHWNIADKVIGFIEQSDGLETSLDAFTRYMPGGEQPLNIITVRDLINYLFQQQQQQQFTGQQPFGFR